jgi:hypothetical protein
MSQAEEKVLAELTNKSIRFRSLKDKKEAGFQLFKPAKKPDTVLIPTILGIYPINTERISKGELFYINDIEHIILTNSGHLWYNKRLSIKTLSDLCFSEYGFNIVIGVEMFESRIIKIKPAVQLFYKDSDMLSISKLNRPIYILTDNPENRIKIISLLELLS